VIRVAGAEVALEIDAIRYVSFVGPIAAGPAFVAADRPGPALQALRRLAVRAELGFADEAQEAYRQAFADAASELEPYVEAPSDTWADVRAAIRIAIGHYRTTTEEPRSQYDDDWADRDDEFRTARRWLDFATELAAEPDARDHREVGDETRVLVSGQQASGRLGFGDRIMSRSLDASSEGAYNDRYQWTITEPIRAEVELRCDPCAGPHLTIAGATGEKIEGDAGRNGLSRIRRDLEPGTYYIWAGTNGPGTVGTYTLVARSRD